MNTIIRIEGMHCDGCASRIKRLLETQAGVRQADVSYAAGEARVMHNEHVMTADRLREVVQGAGYGAEVQGAA